MKTEMHAPGPIGLYDPRDEHDACGVGFIAAIDGTPRREVVEMGIEALKAIWHRGAVDADGKTGDGAGIHLEIPQTFFRDHIRRTGHEPGEEMLAVGMIFLPRIDLGAQETCRGIVEAEILRFGYRIYGWRQVPVDTFVLGEKANATRPEIEQIMIANNLGKDEEAFERDLYIIRRRIEKAVIAAQAPSFYICSLSCRSVIYKGMMLAEQVSAFFPDLEDPDFTSAFAIYHQRYSTNTFPQWALAQPFRMLAHNGEINTLKGNSNWMKSHEIRMASGHFEGNEEDIKPIIAAGSSDSAALDAVFEVFVRAGRSAPMTKTMLVPEAWSKKATSMPDSWRDMYAYCNSVMEPWDGPAALAATDGRWVIGGMDRNGLRPMRYVRTEDGLVIAGSEVGMVSVEEARVIEKGRVGPGQMIGVDMQRNLFMHDAAIKDELAAARPFSEWIGKVTELDVVGSTDAAMFEKDELRRRQVAAGFSLEEMESILHPAVEGSKEAIGSMGDDTPLAVLSDQYRPLSHFFRQNFSQVTNPPIDPLREHRVMSLKTRFGNLRNVLDQDSAQSEILTLESPVMLSGEFTAMTGAVRDQVRVIDCLFPVDGGENALRDAVETVRVQAEEAVRSGVGHVILTDERADEAHAAIPMILAASAVHSWLVREGLRTFCSLNIRSGECIDPHYFAVLIGVGATTVNAYLAEESIRDRHARGLFGDKSLAQCIENYREAINGGLLKILSKMGISVISSYRGGCNFEAVGLSRALVAEYFPGMPSRISGIGLSGIQRKTLALHKRAYASDVVALPVGGFYKFRRNGENHAWRAELMHLMQKACDTNSYTAWKKYSEGLQKLEPIHLRDLLGFKPAGDPVRLREVESVTAIRKRFVTPGMSLGALSQEAHETLSIAMNRIGAKSDSGEGGEDPAFMTPEPSGENKLAKIKQVASGRFGVTAEYLNACEELEIKVAQGAKPGEGGQLPGFKVTEFIAKRRLSTPGVTLISPPPHHDIYSIEDLAQLIYDLKQINPTAKVTVKLVASSGVGTIAAGVAKAKADIILIAGHNGGTGASPQTSIKYAGLPWEMGLTEAHQVLSLNNLRDRITLRTDGGIRTGRDVVMAALMGAEEYGVGTASLVAMGCIMVRQCQSNTCPVGVCTQDPRLREKFTGNADKVVNLFTFIAEEVREILAELGLKSLDEAIGRTDLLSQVSRGDAHLDDLDMNPMLVQIEEGSNITLDRNRERTSVPDTLDAQIVRDAAPFFEYGERMQLAYSVENVQRTIGTRASSHIVQRFGMNNDLAYDQLHVKLSGTAGQSLGAFAAPGIKLEVFGDANDYVAKGLSGGTVVVRPPLGSKLVPHENTIVGNTVLYGATNGWLLANGQGGERFAVRNSGATAVIEGIGSNGCEYMTGGRVVVLGSVGDNFGAGMSGGMAYIYDVEDTLMKHLNDEMVVAARLDSAYWEKELKSVITRHAKETSSPLASEILREWDRHVGRFWHVCPKEMLERIPHPMSDKAAAQRA